MESIGISRDSLVDPGCSGFGRVPRVEQSNAWDRRPNSFAGATGSFPGFEAAASLVAARRVPRRFLSAGRLKKGFEESSPGGLRGDR